MSFKDFQALGLVAKYQILLLSNRSKKFIEFVVKQKCEINQ